MAAAFLIPRRKFSHPLFSKCWLAALDCVAGPRVNIPRRVLLDQFPLLFRRILVAQFDLITPLTVCCKPPTILRFGTTWMVRGDLGKKPKADKWGTSWKKLSL